MFSDPEPLGTIVLEIELLSLHVVGEHSNRTLYHV